MASEEPPPDLRASAELTAAANEASSGEAGALNRMMEAHYPRLSELARKLVSRERPGATLSANALLNEAYLRLINQATITDRGSTYFRACVARTCRRVLVDHARARAALQRGGGFQRQTVLDSGELGIEGGIDLMVLHEAIETLGKLNERMGRIVDMRIFANMTVPECADVLRVSPRTVDKDWLFARAWLKRELG